MLWPQAILLAVSSFGIANFATQAWPGRATDLWRSVLGGRLAVWDRGRAKAVGGLSEGKAEPLDQLHTFIGEFLRIEIKKQPRDWSHAIPF